MFVWFVGSTGIIVSATTLLGAFEGGMVGLLWPLNLPWGFYQYIRNQYLNGNLDTETDRETDEEIVMPHNLEELSVDNNPFVNLEESLPEQEQEQEPVKEQ